jgi:transposase
MQAPLFVRPLAADERAALEAGLRSARGFTVRRCHILLSSAAGQHTTAIAHTFRCNDQTVRNAIHAFHTRGLAALQPTSSRPHTTHATFDADGLERLREFLHQSPRVFGQATSVWTLELAAQVSFTQGLTRRRVSDETIRAAIAQLGVRWKRAKHWITSPDPAYVRKKNVVTA